MLHTHTHRLAYPSGRMGDVCFNPKEDCFKCRGSLSNIPIPPNRPSWCVRKPPDRPGQNLVALWCCLALVACAVCCILCYRYRKKIRKWTPIHWIEERISNVRDIFSSRYGTSTVTGATDSTGKDCDNIATEDKKETSVMLPVTKTNSSGSSPTSSHTRV